MRALFLGAHTDDIEHGAGGTLVKLAEDRSNLVEYITFSLCTDLPRNSAIAEDQARALTALAELNIKCKMLDLPNRLLSTATFKIREVLENVLRESNPDVVFTHWINDIHQDHKTIAEETIRVFRNKTIIFYECLRSCPQFAPNHFIPISEEHLKQKNKLIEIYKTQSSLYYNAPKAITATAMHRGTQVGVEYAEGFIAFKSVGNFLCV